MIHPAARRAVGWVEAGGRLVGHAVLIGPGQAVTCAHVLGDGPEPPAGPAVLHLPNLDGLRVSASIAAWRPYDPTLAAGSDLALLSFDAAGVPPDAWARLDNARPRSADPLVALEFQTARPDGDIREGSVVDGDGAILSVTGDRFIEPGMSGGGLFHPDPGERLVGLVSGRPVATHQTKGYAIPADEIARFVAGAAGSLRDDDARATVETLVAMALGAVGDNMRALIEDIAAHALTVLSRPADTWREEDLTALVDLQLELAEAVEPVAAPESAGGFSAVFAKLEALFAKLAVAGPAAGTPVTLDGEMERALRAALEEIDRLLGEGPCPDEARQALDQLATLVRTALARGTVRLGQLSQRSELARRRCEGGFRTGARALMACIGRRVDMAPPLSVFCDAEEDWAPAMVVIPAGRFRMGSPDDEDGRQLSEGPVHEVSVPLFAIARDPLTFSAFDAFCTATGREAPGDEGWGRADRPVINVSWHDATAYVEWVNERIADGPYRLPSEAEWEYAARAGTETRYPWGDEWDGARANGLDGEPKRTTPVGSYPANGFGLRDMVGNVLEWVEDAWHNDYRSAPDDGSAWLEDDAGDSARRVVRGGSWSYDPRDLRSAIRSGTEPEDRGWVLGFRPARTLFTP